MVTKQEKQEGCIKSLEELATYVTKLRNREYKRNYIGSPHYELSLDVNSTHFLKVILTEPNKGNNDAGEVSIEVVSRASYLIQHRLYLAIEPSANSDTYFGYSSPFFRGKPKEWERVGSMSSDILALFAPRLITEGIQSEAVLNALYLGLPQLLTKIGRLPDFKFE
jgi:hypothetical protein